MVSRIRRQAPRAPAQAPNTYQSAGMSLQGAPAGRRRRGEQAVEAWAVSALGAAIAFVLWVVVR